MAEIDQRAKRQYRVDGKDFTVKRHFTGTERLEDLMAELAVEGAKREMGERSESKESACLKD